MQEDIIRPSIDPTVTPFNHTRAYRTFGATLDPDELSSEDVYCKEIIREQGFDGLPHVVSRRVLDTYVRAGEREIFRGLTHARYADAFREGDFFVGRGAFGSGAYSVGGRDGLAVARLFARDPDGVVLRMTLKHGARIGDFDELTRTATRERDETVRFLRAEQSRAVTLATERDEPEEAWRIQAQYDDLVNAAHAQYDDLGRYAAYLGYDIVQIPEFDYYLVLNRTALRIQREDMR